ncbi:MAG: DNA-invertase hin [Elusimicrobia bacterium ADurb.Bin231]|nr:MAG: DNA-invertase hin [Elusimicrobia bacterium ADurb.Bin231]
MNPKSKKNVGIYCRVSTLDQEKGLKSQEKSLKDYCDNHDFSNLVWYKDKVTGSTTDRPAFNKLKQDIFNGKVDTVICWKLDRLSRSLKDGITILTDWLDKNVRVIATAQQLDFSGAVGQLIASVLFAIAAMERENLRENTKRGMAAAKAKGVKLGKRPKLFAKDIVPLLQSGLSIGEVAIKLNKTRQAIYNALRRENSNLIYNKF